MSTEPTPTTSLSPADELTAFCDARLAAAAAKLAELKRPDPSRTALATLELFNAMTIEVDNAGARAGLYAQVHPLEAVREAGDASIQRLTAFTTDVQLDRGLYDALAALDPGGLDAAAQRMLRLTLRDFRRAGVDQDDATRQQLRELSEREVKVGQTFDKNIREDVRAVKLDPAQLAGMPEDWIAAHPAGADGKVTVTTDYPDYVPFRTYARDAAARRQLFHAYMNRAWPQNDAVFKELLAIRQERARVLGYRDWADYDAEIKMIKRGDAIGEFIDQIAGLSQAAGTRDYRTLLDRKRHDDPSATEVDLAEFLYYEQLVRKEQYAVDSQEARKYFDFPKVKAGLLVTTGALFGLEYRAAPGAPRWHADVDVYDVVLVDAGETIGRIYLDLHPREGKYKHAAQFTLLSGVRGTQLAEGALVCNFPRGLMEHDDVVTMFHEFGHLMHHVLAGRHRWVRFSGVATEWDFVEAPSQMLEEWAWDPGVLATFATDEQGRPIPAELVRKMKAAEEFGKGYTVRQQMFYAALSLRYHRLQPAALAALDATQLLADTQRQYSVFPYTPDTHMQASFGHLNGYSSGYYTYMWSLVIAKDLLSAFKQAGLMDRATATRYRDLVLARGGEKDAAELVQDFLGRPYGFDAFKAWLDAAQ